MMMDSKAQLDMTHTHAAPMLDDPVASVDPGDVVEEPTSEKDNRFRYQQTLSTNSDFPVLDLASN